MDKNQSMAAIKRRSGHLCRFLTVTWVCLVGLVMLERFGALSMKVWKGGFDWDMAQRFGMQLVSLCPEAFYLLALWGIRESLAALARGELFAPTIVRMLKRVGVTLAMGAFFNVFLAAGLARALGHGPGYFIAYDVSGVVLGAIGLSLTVLARVLQHAGEIQSELEEIF